MCYATIPHWASTMGVYHIGSSVKFNWRHKGIILSMGGNIAIELQLQKVNVLGTTHESIDNVKNQ